MISPNRLTIARDVLKGGCSLGAAASRIGVRPSELDLALWQNIGGKLPQPPANARPDWRHADIKSLKEAHARGLTDEQISAELTAAGIPRTVNAVQKRRATLGLEMNRAAPSAPRRFSD